MPVPSAEELGLLKWAWTVMLAPITWIVSRYNRLSQLMDEVRTDLAAMKAHSEHTKSDLERIVKVLDRMEERMNRRRKDD